MTAEDETKDDDTKQAIHVNVRVSRASRLSHPKTAPGNVPPERSLRRHTTMAPGVGNRRLHPKTSGRKTLKRSHTAGAERKSGNALRRKHKKGIQVAITVRKRTEAERDAADAQETKSNDTDLDHLNLYQLDVQCTGKHHRKVGWPDVDAFWECQQVDKDRMCDLLATYTAQQYPDRKDAANLRPKRCYLQDCPLRGIRYYKDFDWDPVKLTLRARADQPVQILESWTRPVTLEEIPLDFSTDINSVLLEQGDKAVTSTLTKSPLQGHPLAKAMMTTDTQIVTELRGLESVVGVLGTHDDTTCWPDTDPVTGHSVWRDVKTLRALLHGQPVPAKKGKGTKRVLQVVGLETYLKARVYYRASFEGDVVPDHGVGPLLGERWWAHPLKDIMMGYGVDNAADVYEDIELRVYSEIGYQMDNE